MNMKTSAILISGLLFLLGTSSQVWAGPRQMGSHHGYTVHETHTTVTRSHDYYPENRHYNQRHHKHQARHHYKHHRKHHHHPHWKHHSSRHGHSHHAPRYYYEERVYYRAPERHYQPAPQYSAQGYNGNALSETILGGALGAAAGAAIGAVVGEPADGAAIGAVVGGIHPIGTSVAKVVERISSNHIDQHK